MMDELKACPFCGHQAERKGNRKYKKGYAATVGCMNQLCPAKIEQATICGTVEDAYKHAENVWNRRTQPESTISKVETVAQPENKPLSIEELRQMDGEPVWIEIIVNTYGLGSHYNVVFESHNRNSELIHFLDGAFRIDYYGKTWIAYKNKPGQEEK